MQDNNEDNKNQEKKSSGNVDTLKDGRVLTELVKIFNSDRTNDNMISVLRCLRDSIVDVPVSMRMSDEDLQNFLSAQPGDKIKSIDDIGMKPDILTNKEKNMFFFPVFSNVEQIPEDYMVNFSIMSSSFIDCANMALSMSEVKKIVINPFTNSLILDENLLEIVKKLPRTLGED